MFEYNGMVSHILDKIRMKPKVIVETGVATEAKMDKLGVKVLCHIWMPVADELVFRLNVNLHERKKGVKTGPDC